MFQIHDDIFMYLSIINLISFKWLWASMCVQYIALFLSIWNKLDATEIYKSVQGSVELNHHTVGVWDQKQLKYVAVVNVISLLV